VKKKPSDGASEPKNTADLVVVCDESGAKGYAKQSETTEGETGVFAGFVVFRPDLPALEHDLRSAANLLPQRSGKLHITDLPEGVRDPLRHDIFATLLRHKVFCFYEAIHVQGFHEDYRRSMALVAPANSTRTSKIKMSNPLARAESLHVTLFFGFFTKVVSFCLKSGLSEVKIDVRTDRVDAPILKDFEKRARQFLSNEGLKVKFTKWNPDSGTAVSRSIIIAPLTPALPLSAEISFVPPAPADAELILAADVLANSLNDLFQNRNSEQKFLPLNSLEAISSHPLFQCLDSYRPGFDFSDFRYSHPKRPR
jgi:hypothetical protein